ncbi:MAG: hypothetical protein WCE79_05985 [Xanthobacteraceae bacterium]
MLPGVRLGIALILMTLSTAATGQDQALETRGAWRLVADGEDFALRTQALDAPDSTLSFACRKAQNRFAFEIKSPALAARPNGKDIRIGFKVDDDDQAWLNLSTGPDGTVPIIQRTAFWIIHGELTREGAKEVAFTAGDHGWKFALDGLRGLTERLTARCGFDPPRSTRELR